MTPKVSKRQAASDRGGTRTASGGRARVQTVEKVVLPGWGLTPKLGITLRATSVFNVTHAGTFQTYGVSCNNPYMPFITTTTSEVPSYLTYLSLAYSQLYTLSSRVRVEVLNSTCNDSIAVALGYDGNVSGTTSINTLSETRDSVSSTLGYYTGGNNRAVLQGSFTPMRYLGIASNSPDNICTGGAPPNQYYWVFGLQSVAGGTGNVCVRFVVEYDVVFSELVAPPP